MFCCPCGETPRYAPGHLPPAAAARRGRAGTGRRTRPGWACSLTGRSCSETTNPPQLPSARAVLSAHGRDQRSESHWWPEAHTGGLRLILVARGSHWWPEAHTDGPRLTLVAGGSHWWLKQHWRPEIHTGGVRLRLTPVARDSHLWPVAHTGSLSRSLVVRHCSFRQRSIRSYRHFMTRNGRTQSTEKP